jgi:2-dehydropantoate 2-reductase
VRLLEPAGEEAENLETEPRSEERPASERPASERPASERRYPVRVIAAPAFDPDAIREESGVAAGALREALAGCAGARCALVLVKSWQTRRAACLLESCLAPDGLALSLQNGLGNRETLAEVLGPDRVGLGVATVGANLAAPGVVRAGGQGSLTLGVHPRLAPWVDLLRAAGFSVNETPDPDALLWGKLATNAAINPLTALLGVQNGELLKRPTARLLMAGLARETAAVAAAQGIHLPYPDPVQAAEAVAGRTASNRSSMLQDVQRGASTEIDAICGNIVEAGEQFGVDTPLNRTMWLLVKAAVAKSMVS